MDKQIEEGLAKFVTVEEQNERKKVKEDLHKHWLSDQHLRALMDISNGYDKEEAELICYVFARRWPEVMFGALNEKHLDMCHYIDQVNHLYSGYAEKEVM